VVPLKRLLVLNCGLQDEAAHSRAQRIARSLNLHEESLMLHLFAPLVVFGVKKLSECVSSSRPSARSSGGSYTIVDQGNHGCYHWFAVPGHQAAAFKAAWPDAGTSENFLKVVRNKVRREPDAERHLAPITQQVIAVIREYPNCQIFVIVDA
jgi:hypothetical protein